MAHSQDVRDKVRRAYVFNSLSLEIAAMQGGVSFATARRWKKEASEAGDDWDKIRTMLLGLGREDVYASLQERGEIVIDDELALAGSANLDGRSLFLNYEMMVAFYDRKAVTDFASWIESRRQEGKPYLVRQPGMLRELAEGLLLWLAFQL